MSILCWFWCLCCFSAHFYLWHSFFFFCIVKQMLSPSFVEKKEKKKTGSTSLQLIKVKWTFKITEFLATNWSPQPLDITHPKPAHHKDSRKRQHTTIQKLDMVASFQVRFWIYYGCHIRQKTRNLLVELAMVSMSEEVIPVLASTIL